MLWLLQCIVDCILKCFQSVPLIKEPLLFKLQHTLSVCGGTVSIQKMLLLVWGESGNSTWKSKSFALSWPSCLIFFIVYLPDCCWWFCLASTHCSEPMSTLRNGCFELAQYVSPLSGHGVYLKHEGGSCLSYSSTAKASLLFWFQY